MSKRKKITLTLAAALVAIAAGAQIYTNHKVDQVLQKFPYSLDNQAMLQITETNKNFFTRDLTFSVKNAEGQSADVISTQLTTLPFFITAESKFSEQFVRQLNKTLNITLDKNTINSKFSPVGDYLQSDILTEFRDFANKPQQATISLNFLNNKEIELNANLTGFNYDSESKLQKVEGKVRLIPVTSSQYDINNVELTAENAELVLLNGENTRLQLKNATYNFNTKRDENTEKRDLITKFSSDILRISNKNRTTEESQTTFGGLNLSLNQQGVPSAVNFVNEFKKLYANNQNIKEGTKLLISVLTQNNYFDGKLSVISVNAPKNQKPYFNLQNGELTLKLVNTDLKKANVNAQLNVESVKQTPEDESQKWDAQKGKLSIQLKDYNLVNELALTPFFLETLSAKEPPLKDNKDFLNAKEKWAKEFTGNLDFDSSIGALNLFSNEITDLKFSDKYESLENDQYNENITLNAKKISVPSQSAQIEDLSISIPIKGNYHKSYLSTSFCSFYYYEMICYGNLTKETQEKYYANQWKDVDLIVDNAKASLNLNTLPETHAYPVKIEMDGIVSREQEEKDAAQNSSILNNMEGSLNASIDKRLVDGTDEKTSQIKEQSAFWYTLKNSIKQQDMLLPIFTEENENYVLKVEKNENGTFINGRTPEDIQQDILMQQGNEEDDESEK